MHELGILVHMAREIESLAKENHLTEVSSITMEIGEVSGVVPDYLTDCWEYYKKKFPLFEKSRLEIEMIKGLTLCQDCHHVYETVTYAKICPHCQSDHTVLAQGLECNIKQIEAQ